jgi:hypothetical protein
MCFMLKFEWDPRKAEANEKKHGVSFEESATVFKDPLSLTIRDIAHSSSEERLATLGRSSADRLLVVVHLDRSKEIIRLISARLATRREKRSYEQE